MPPATTVSLRELADLSIGTPEVGAVNFTALHTLIVAMLKNLDLQNTRIDFQAPSPEPSRLLLSARSSLSTPHLPAPKEAPKEAPKGAPREKRRGVGRVPPSALESQVKDLGGQVEDLSKQLKRVDSQMQGIATHVQRFSQASGLDLASQEWPEEQEVAMQVLDRVRTGSILKDAAEELSFARVILQRVDELEKLFKDREQFLELVSRKLSLVPGAEEVTMVTWEELEQAITDGWRASQAGSETVMGFSKRRGFTSLTSPDGTLSGASTKQPSIDQALDSAGGLGPDQTASGSGGAAHPSEGVISREQSRGPSGTGRQQQPRARDEAGMPRLHQSSVLQFKPDSDRRRSREKLTSTLPRRDERDARPGPVQQDLTSAREQPSRVPASQSQVHLRSDRRGFEPTGMDHPGLVHAGTYLHGVVPLSMGQLRVPPPEMDDQEWGRLVMDEQRMLPPSVPGRDQQGLELPSTDQHGLVSVGAYQHGMVLPGIDQRSMEPLGMDQRGFIISGMGQQGLVAPGVDQQGLILPVIDQHGLILPFTDQHGLVSPGMMPISADQQGFVQPSLEATGFIQPGTEQHDLIQSGRFQHAVVQPGAYQPGLVQPGADQRGLVRPGMDQSGLAQPGRDQHGLVQSGTGQGGLVQPGVDQLGMVQPGADLHGLVQPGMDQSGLAQPGRDQHGLVQSGTGQGGLVQPGVDQPGMVQPGADQHGLVQIGAYQPGLVQPGMDQHGLIQSGAFPSGWIQPDVYLPGLVQPGTYPHGLVQPGADPRSLVQPGIDQRGLVQLGADQYGFVQPGIDQLGLVQRGADQQGLVQSGAVQYGVVQPGMDQHGLAQPGALQSSLGQPGAVQHGFVQPGVDQRGLVQPDSLQRVLVQPGAVQPGLVQPGVDQHGLVQSGAVQPGLVQPGVDQRGLVQPGADQRGLVQPGVDQRGLVQPGADQRGLVQPGVDQRGLVQPGAVQPGLVQPGVDQRGLVQPGAVQPGLVQPGVDQRGLVQPGAVQPGLVQPGVDQHGLVQPDSLQRALVKPGAVQPGLVQPGVDQHGLVQPGADQPGLVQPGVDQRGLVQPGADQSGLAQVGAVQHSLVQPGADQRGLGQPGTDERGLGQPGTDERGLVQPGADQRGLGQPGADQRGLGQPGMDEHGLVQPGEVQRGLVQPGVDQRGLVQPGEVQRGLVQPGADQRSLVQPGVDQRGLVQPGEVQRGLVQPGVDQRGLVQPGEVQRGLVQPGVDQRGLVQPGEVQRGLVQPGVDQRGLVQPGEVQHGLVQPGADQRGLVQPGVDQRGLVQPGEVQRGLVQPGVDQRGLVQPGEVQRGLVQPGAVQYTLMQPGAVQRSLVQPGAVQHGLVQPGVDQRGLVPPGAVQHGLVQPGVDQRGLVPPGAVQRGLVQPGVDQRGLVPSGAVQRGLVQPGVDQRGLVQPGVDQRGLVQPGVDQRGLVQPGVDQRGLVQPGAGQPGLVQPGADQLGMVQPGIDQQGLVQSQADPRGLVQPGAYPLGFVQPGVYLHDLSQPGTYPHGLVQPGMERYGLRQSGTYQPGLTAPGTKLRGSSTFQADSTGFISARPYQHGMVPPGREQYGQMSPLLASQGLASPGIDQRSLVPPETYQQGLMHPGTDQHGPIPLSTGLGSTHPDQQHLASLDPGYLSADQHGQEGLDPNRTRASDQPGIPAQKAPGQDVTLFRSPDSLHRVSSEKSEVSSEVLSERRDSLCRMSSSFPTAVETFRLLGELSGLYMGLKESMKDLDEEQAGQTDMEKIQFLLAQMVKRTVPSELQEQLKTIKTLAKEVRQEKVKVERLQRILEGEGTQEAGKELKAGELRLQLGVLRVTVADIEKELAELRESQDRGKAAMENSVSEASLYLQDQLDKLRMIIESMLTSSSTLLSMSMAPHKAHTLAPGQIDPEATCPACSLDVGHQVSMLVQRYEQLQDMVNSLVISRPSKKAKLQRQDEELLGRVQSAILQVQGDCEKLNITTSNLIEDHRQKQKDIAMLYQGLEKLEKEKANREHLEMEIDVKADKSALATKVSRIQFDATTEQLNHMMQELVAKMSGQEQDWQKMLDKLLTEMDNKLDRLELDPVKQLLEDRWKSLRQQLRERPPLYQADEAAAMRRQLLAHFHCLSCDRPLETPVTGHAIPVIPAGPGLPGHHSIRPYTVFELEQVRQHSRNLKLGGAFPRGDLAQMEQSVGRLRSMHSKMLMNIEKVQIHFGGSTKASSQIIRELLHSQCLGSPCYKRVTDMADYTYSTVPRRCGGSHTLTYPYHRSRPQHLPRGLYPTEEIQIAMKRDEVDILGLDGHIYKGRMDTRLPGILSKDSSGTSKRKSQQPRPHVHRPPSLGGNGHLPSRPQSAQMSAGNISVSSHQQKARPSSEGRLSQPNTAHPPSSATVANRGLERHMDMPPGEGLEEPTRGPRSSTAQ
ncbi:glutamine-rich protein 2 [Macaca nemestrina]|uniref:glutamine-rich protein 2 n=1 Tax=Macaca nemestrina TaxID=9545 RepID=UPI0039B88F02